MSRLFVGLGIDYSVQLRHRHVPPFANRVGQNADQVLVVDIFLAVGQGYKAVIRVLQFLAREREPKLLQAMAQGGAAGMLAQHQVSLGNPHQGRAS